MELFLGMQMREVVVFPENASLLLLHTKDFSLLQQIYQNSYIDLYLEKMFLSFIACIISTTDEYNQPTCWHC